MINRKCFPSIYKKDIGYYCDDKTYQVHINIHPDELRRQNEGLCGHLLMVAKYNFFNNAIIIIQLIFLTAVSPSWALDSWASEISYTNKKGGLQQRKKIKKHPPNRIRTSDLRISALPLQSSALPTELSVDYKHITSHSGYVDCSSLLNTYFILFQKSSFFLRWHCFCLLIEILQIAILFVVRKQIS